MKSTGERRESSGVSGEGQHGEPGAPVGHPGLQLHPSEMQHPRDKNFSVCNRETLRAPCRA